MKISLVADNLTTVSLAPECQVASVRLWGGHWAYPSVGSAFLLVESAWEGIHNSWKYHIASYPEHPKRNNRALARLVAAARDKGIPTVFWNKEDSIHFERFIASARLFDHVFTVDAVCVPRYKAEMGENASVHTLMFAVQPRFHNFTGFHFKHRAACFVGSYSRHIHPVRRGWQNMMFRTALETGLGLVVVDRNSDRKAPVYRYPEWNGIRVRPAVSYPETAGLYKDFLVSLNVNTMMNSPSMVSRRLMEILACGGIAVTNPSPAVETMFGEYCWVVHDEKETREVLSRLSRGESALDRERARAGAEYVLQHHTWTHRLEEIVSSIGL